MNKTTKIIVAVIIVAVVAGGVMALSGDSSNQKAATGQSEQTAQPTEASNPTAKIFTITYGSGGFGPTTVTMSAGDSLKFVNNSNSAIDPSSDPHPAHTTNPELNVGDIAPGQSKTVTLTTQGTWGYHNHYQASDRGEVIVK